MYGRKVNYCVLGGVARKFCNGAQLVKMHFFFLFFFFSSITKMFAKVVYIFVYINDRKQSASFLSVSFGLQFLPSIQDLK